MANRKIKAELEVDGKDSTGPAFRSVATRMGQIEKRIGQFNKQAAAFNRTAGEFGKRFKDFDKTAGAMARHHDNMAKASGLLMEMGARVGGVAAIGYAFAKVTKESANFQESLVNIQKKAGASSEQMATMRDEIVDLSHKMPTSLDEISKAFERGAAAGIPLSDLKEFASLSLKVADAWDVTAEESANAFAGFHASMGIKFGQDMKNYASLINDLADSGISDERDIKDFVDRFGASGVNFGMSPQEVAAYGAAMLNLKMPAEVAARAMNTLTNTLMAPENLSKKAGGAFEKIVGNTKEFAKLSGNDKMVFFLKQLDKMTSQQRASTLGALLGQGFSDETMRLVAGLQEVLRNLDVAHKETAKASNSVDQVYEKRMELFNSQIAVLQNNIKNIEVSLGNLILPGATGAVKGVNDYISDLDAERRGMDGMTTDEINAQRRDYIKRYKELHPATGWRDKIILNDTALKEYKRSLQRVGRGEIRDVSEDLDAEQSRQTWSEGYASGKNKASVGRQNYQPPPIDHGYTIKRLPKIGPEIASRPKFGSQETDYPPPSVATTVAKPPSPPGMSLADQYDEYHQGWRLMRENQPLSAPPQQGVNELMTKLYGNDLPTVGADALKQNADEAGKVVVDSGKQAGDSIKSGGESAAASILEAARALVDAANRLNAINVKVQNASSAGGAVGQMAGRVNADTGKSNTFASAPPGGNTGGGGGF
ncbi:phage tail tape measure protein [Rhizobium tropici]|uniref:Phage tail tape measure protein n=1 Tax=Rhizobium tropici TaxID=398 RepID=A0A329YDU9_RHITR|nr:phage tail tape measure protein [Rhizobium tropici]RAX42399.1 phage tail tape measure protein [Rhizobium tropici]